jgi:hypothetical protein
MRLEETIKRQLTEAFTKPDGVYFSSLGGCICPRIGGEYDYSKDRKGNGFLGFKLVALGVSSTNANAVDWFKPVREDLDDGGPNGARDYRKAQDAVEKDVMTVLEKAAAAFDKEIESGMKRIGFVSTYTRRK